MRKVQTEEELCCAYREKLLAKRRKEARSRKKPRNVTAGCCSSRKRLTCEVIAETSTPVICNGKKMKKKIKRIKKQDAGCPPDIDKLFPQIQPSISEREKYVNIIHIVCILEAEELIRMKEIQKIREKLKESAEAEGNQIVSEADNVQKVEQTSSLTKTLNSEASNEDNQEKDALPVRGKTSEPVPQNRNRCAKMKMTAGKYECSSICSFDSEIDLTGLHLTKEDVEQIEKDREQLRQQQNSECESQDAEAEE